MEYKTTQIDSKGKDMKKRLLAILMTICMTVVFMPTFAWAENTPAGDTESPAATTETNNDATEQNQGTEEPATEEENQSEFPNPIEFVQGLLGNTTLSTPDLNNPVCPGSFKIKGSDTVYNSLEAAAQAVPEGGTIVLQADCTATPVAIDGEGNPYQQNIIVGRDGLSAFTLDLNGKVMNFMAINSTIYPVIDLVAGTMTIENGYVLATTPREFQANAFYKAESGTKIIFRNGDAEGEYGFYGGSFFAPDSGSYGEYDIQSGHFFMGYTSDTPSTSEISKYVNTGSALNVRNPRASGLDYSSSDSRGVFTQDYNMNYVSENSRNPVEILNASGQRISTYFALDAALKCVTKDQSIRMINKDTTLLREFVVNSTSIPHVETVGEVKSVTIDMNGFDLISYQIGTAINVETGYGLALKDDRAETGYNKSVVSYKSNSLEDPEYTVIQVNGVFSSEKVQYDFRQCGYIDDVGGDITVIRNEGKVSLNETTIICAKFEDDPNINTTGIENHTDNLTASGFNIVGEDGVHMIYGIKQAVSGLTVDNVDISISGTASYRVYGIYSSSADIINGATVDVSDVSGVSYVYCVGGSCTVMGGHYYSNNGKKPFATTSTKAKGGYYSCKYSTFPSGNLYSIPEYQCIAFDETYKGKQYLSRVVADSVARAYQADGTEIGDGYPTLQEAIDAIEDGSYTKGTVKLIKSITETNQLRSNCGEAQFGEAAGVQTPKTIYFDLNGYSINVSMPTKYLIFVERSKVKLYNSQSTVSHIVNTAGDAIHVGDEKSASNSVLVIADPNHKVHISGQGALADEADDAIQIGWGWDDAKTQQHIEYKGKVNITGGCYEGSIRMPEYDRGNSKYDIQGGYFTDGGIKFGGETESTVGKNAFVNGACVGIDNPDAEVVTSKGVTYPVKVVPRVFVYAVSAICLDKIQVYYYVTGLSTEDFNSGKYKITFQQEGKTKQEVIINSTNAKPGTLGDKTVYKVSVPDKIATKNIVDDIYTEVLDTSGAKYDTYHYKVSQYCYDTKAKDPAIGTSGEYPQRDLCLSLLNYGTACQNYFTYRTTNLANKDLSGDELTVSMPDKADDITAVESVVDDQCETADAIGQSLLLEDETSIKCYLNLSKAPGKYEVKYSKGSSIGADAKTLTPQSLQTGTEDIHYNGSSTTANYYVVVPEIKSTYIEDPYTVSVVDTDTPDKSLKIVYSASTWAKNVWGKSTNTTALCKAIVAFGKTSVAYSNYKNSQNNSAN